VSPARRHAAAPGGPSVVDRTHNGVVLTMAERIVSEIEEPALTDGHVTVQGPGGTGKSAVLAALARRFRAAGVEHTTVEQLHTGGSPAGPTVVVVDDAHRLNAAKAAPLRAALERPEVRLLVAFRPWPRPGVLTDLVDALGGERLHVVLGPVDDDVVQDCVVQYFGSQGAPSWVVDFVLRQTGGLPALVEPLVRSLAGRYVRAAKPVPRAAADGSDVPRPVIDRVVADLALIDEPTRAVLHALALGAPLDADLLADLLLLSPAEATELVSRARATGALLTTGRVVPLVRAALLGHTPADATRATRRRLLSLLLDRGEEPVDLAHEIAADGIREPGAARLLEREADAVLATDPARAGELLASAAAAGAPPAGLSVRRALAAALVGNLDGALQWADTAVRGPDTADRAEAAGITAAVMAQRGLLARSAQLYQLGGREHAGSAALALLGIGDRARADAVLDAAEAAPDAWVPGTVRACESLMAQAVLQSVKANQDSDVSVASALSTLARAATLVEPVGSTALLMDTPAALAALVAMHNGELGIAESALRRAVDAGTGGPPARPRHLLLLAWAAMLRGRMQSAADAMDAAAEGNQPLEPRDELFLRGLQVGLARRASDLPSLLRAWEPAREAVLRYPVDLYSLLPLGELVVAGARLGEAPHLAPHLEAAADLLDRLDNPPLWSTSLRWSGAQAAIVNDDPAMLEPHATALVQAARRSNYAAVLAGAGRTWLRVLGGAVVVPDVLAAVERLTAVGLAWDGSRLAGQAAARAADARDRTALLQCARALSGDEEKAAPAGGPASLTVVPPPSPSGVLSPREREIAALVIEGRTYREIGSRLFISAKTVEHHVSRMRQRLGAGSRPELMDKLRAELG
jgi:DNA-binding CsgD family transcriptional regulator